jgi:hypothetical protein
MYTSQKGDDNGDKIGSIIWFNYKQELAIANGVNMTKQPYITSKPGHAILFELDYTNISQETINEIGDSSNLNIAIIFSVCLSAAYSYKEMGVKIMKRFIEQMKGKCGYIIIQPFEPVQLKPSQYLIEGMTLDGVEDDYEKAQYQLKAYWLRCGFKLFKNYDNVFICNVNQAVQKHNEATRSTTG